MEWQDILQYGLLIGTMFLMMRLGGCCGGHSNGSDKNEQKSGCCGGNQTSKEPENTRKDPVKG